MMPFFRTMLQAGREMGRQLLPPACLYCGAYRVSPSHFRLCPGCRRGIEKLPPGRCICCALPFAAGSSRHLCQSCLADPPPFDRVYASGLYLGLLREMIQRFKYDGAVGLDLPLGRMLSHALRPEAHRFDLLMPVPLCRKRLRLRGYNQALLLARMVGRELDMRVVVRGIQRVRETVALEGLGVKDRRRSLSKAFRVVTSVEGRRILLVDDVMTSGATAREIGWTLKQAGALEVCLAVVARTPRHDFGASGVALPKPSAVSPVVP